MVFNDMESLKKYVLNATFQAMEGSMCDIVAQVEQQAIVDEVYSAGKPKEYERRYGEGGLMDTKNMFPSLDMSGNTVNFWMWNMTAYNDDSGTSELPLRAGRWPIKPGKRITQGYNGNSVGLAETVEYGIVENYDMGEGWWSKPRPFTETTKQYLENSKLHVEGLKAGLNSLGIPTI